MVKGEVFDSPLGIRWGILRPGRETRLCVPWSFAIVSEAPNSFFLFSVFFLTFGSGAFGNSVA